jgi:hypothetical protein
MLRPILADRSVWKQTHELALYENSCCYVRMHIYEKRTFVEGNTVGGSAYYTA